MAINKALILSFYDAASLLDDVRICYQQAKQLQTKVALYQSGTNPQFNGLINAIVSPADRQRLVAILTQVSALATELETNYSDFINPV